MHGHLNVKCNMSNFMALDGLAMTTICYNTVLLTPLINININNIVLTVHKCFVANLMQHTETHNITFISQSFYLQFHHKFISVLSYADVIIQ
jgi:hypothetical protein